MTFQNLQQLAKDIERSIGYLGSWSTATLKPNKGTNDIYISISLTNAGLPKALEKLHRAVMKYTNGNYLLNTRTAGSYVLSVWETPEEERDAYTLRIGVLMEQELELQKPILAIKKNMLLASKHLLTLKQGNTDAH